MLSHKITGVAINYYFICHRELWFYYHRINMEPESELVKIGKNIEFFYKRDNKIKDSIFIDEMISPDIIKRGKDVIYIIEIKKSSKMKKAAIWQLKYYLWYLSRRGLKAKGKLIIPEEGVEKTIKLTAKDVIKLKQIISRIIKIINLDKPPKAIRKPYCRKCSYRILCLGDEI